MSRLEIGQENGVTPFPASSSEQDEVCFGEVEEAVELDEKNNRSGLENIIKQFRDSVSDIGLHDHLMTDRELLRWLNARSMDLQKAEEMLRASAKWRKENQIDSIFDWEPPSHFYKEFPFQICGFDSDGDQFGVITYSKWNIEDFIQSVPKDQGKTHIRYFWKCLETVKKIMRAHSTPDKTIHSGIVIIDMEGLAVTQFASREVLEVILETTRQFEANYPGFLKKAVVVNTPQVFTILYQLLRPFLSEETVASIEIHGYYDDWRSVLRNNHGLPLDLLPSRHGGSNTTVKNYHPSHGHYLTFPKHSDIDESALKVANVPAGQKLDIDFDIKDPHTNLTWAFRTIDYDIGFGVFHVENGVEVQVVDFCRVDSHVLMQRGSFVCEQPGKYIVRFDNTSSWFNPKSLYYKIERSQ